MIFDPFHAEAGGEQEKGANGTKHRSVTATEATVARSQRGAPPPRVIERRKALPGSRAVVGALLMALSAIGVYVAASEAGSSPADPVVIAAREVSPGEQIEARDLRTARADLPADVRDGTFSEPGELVGRVALAGLGVDEIIQAGAVTDDRADESAYEVALTLPRPQVAVGRLKQGERVDVFVTRDDRTASVARAAVVVQIDEGPGTLTSSREITLVVAVEDSTTVAAVVHALRTGDVTVVRSTLETDPGPAGAVVYEG